MSLVVEQNNNYVNNEYISTNWTSSVGINFIHIEAKIKWLLFYRWNLQIHFLNDFFLIQISFNLVF